MGEIVHIVFFFFLSFFLLPPSPPPTNIHRCEFGSSCTGLSTLEVLYSSPVPVSGIALSIVDSSFQSDGSSAIEIISANVMFSTLFSAINENTYLTLLTQAAPPVEEPTLLVSFTIGGKLAGKSLCITDVDSGLRGAAAMMMMMMMHSIDSVATHSLSLSLFAGLLSQHQQEEPSTIQPHAFCKRLFAFVLSPFCGLAVPHNSVIQCPDSFPSFPPPVIVPSPSPPPPSPPPSPLFPMPPTPIISIDNADVSNTHTYIYI